MQRSNVAFLAGQILKAIQKDSADKAYFVIDFDPREKVEPKSNFDEIMVYHALPEELNKLLELKEVSELLVTASNEMPLWIRLVKNLQEDTYDLLISKRFRKMNVISEWHRNNQLKPIIIE